MTTADERRGALEAVERIVNAVLAGETMTGRAGATVHALDHDALAEVMRRYRP